jgi:hypothetical protein
MVMKRAWFSGMKKKGFTSEDSMVRRWKSGSEWRFDRENGKAVGEWLGAELQRSPLEPASASSACFLKEGGGTLNIQFPQAFTVNEKLSRNLGPLDL